MNGDSTYKGIRVNDWDAKNEADNDYEHINDLMFMRPLFLNL